jgi:hypothetical protein
MVMPSEWIPVIFNDPGWESPEQAQRAMTLLMRFHSEIASDLSPNGRRYSIIIDRLGDGADAIDLADDWCWGYAGVSRKSVGRRRETASVAVALAPSWLSCAHPRTCSEAG